MTNTREHVIYFDIDGTLLDNYHNCVPDSVVPALQMLKDAGYLLCIATGRSLPFVLDEVKNLFPWDGYVCVNGQAIYNKNREIESIDYMDRNTVNEIIKISSDTNTPVFFTGPDGGNVYNFVNINAEKGFGFLNMETPEVNQNIDLNGVLYSMVFRETGNEFLEYKQIDGVVVCPGIDSYADINVAGYNKYVGISKSLKIFNKTKYIGVGDSLNDIEMLVHADQAIVMGSGHEKVKPLATYLTSDVDKDGILNAAKWILENDFE